MVRLVMSLMLMLVNLPALCLETLPIDASHSAVIFSWNHRGYSHPLARLEQIHGNVLMDRADLTQSSVSVTMPLGGLRTGDDDLDKRLRGAEFFDAARYPEITFKSTKVETAGANALKITGDLVVHGVSKSVVLDATVNKINDNARDKPAAGFDAAVMLRRSDFGVSKYVPMVADELLVHITLEAHQE